MATTSPNHPKEAFASYLGVPLELSSTVYQLLAGLRLVPYAYSASGVLAVVIGYSDSAHEELKRAFPIGGHPIWLSMKDVKFAQELVVGYPKPDNPTITLSGTAGY